DHLARVSGGEMALREIEWVTPVLACADMRRQQKWTCTLLFHLQAYLSRESTRSKRPLAPELEPRENGGHHEGGGHHEEGGSQGRSAQSVRLIFEVSESSLEVALEIGDHRSVPLRLHYDAEAVLCLRDAPADCCGDDRGFTFGAPWPLEDYPAVTREDYERMHTVVEMFRENFLQPVVVTLVGSRQGRNQYADLLYRLALAAIGAQKLITTTLSLLKEEDNCQIVGGVSDIHGGLFKFIDKINNPNVSSFEGGQISYGLVQVDVNEVGQLMLRELTESGASATHRLEIQKDRLMFVLSVVEGSEVSPQVLSRSIVIFRCG
ncbi:hypothetical protein CYMTET_33838, partial [Cymbomonas tetramitiformis]